MSEPTHYAFTNTGVFVSYDGTNYVINTTANVSSFSGVLSTVTYNTISVGNSAQGSFINSTTIAIGNSSSYIVSNSSTITLYGNSSNYVVSNTSTLLVYSTTSGAIVNTTYLSVGNSTVYTLINSTAVIPGSVGGVATMSGFFTANSTHVITSSKHLMPSANGTYDLGSAALRWSTIYTSDLDLNNGIGDWTIVEGEDDLFLYNNKKSKVYKFALIEVDPSQAVPKK